MARMKMGRVLEGQRALVTGASSGIGAATAKEMGRAGAAVVVNYVTGPDAAAAVVEEIVAAGGRALAVKADVSNEAEVVAMFAAARAELGGIDILVNNASAISITGTIGTPLRRFDLMHQVNVRGTFACSQACLPHLLQAQNPHILNLSPPLNMESRWFSQHCAYTMSKYGMSMCVLGMSEEFREAGVAINALWPRTTIATAAISNLLGGETVMRGSRKPEILADAAHFILTRPSRSCTGNFLIDDEVLAHEGITDLSGYASVPGEPLFPDFFL